jgi:hypothetical protein
MIRRRFTRSQAGRSNGLAVLTGEHLAALALREAASASRWLFAWLLVC